MSCRLALGSWLIVACAAAPAASTVDESAFGPLDVGADYATYTRVSDEPFLSAAHGDRWVEVWVSPPAADAYLTGAPIPVGTVVVKTSVEADGDGPGTYAGPTFVMQKLAEGADPERGDWFYAIHWAEPTPEMRERFGSIYWRGRSPKVDYCFDACHDIYDRGLGGLTPSSLVPR